MYLLYLQWRKSGFLKLIVFNLRSRHFFLIINISIPIPESEINETIQLGKKSFSDSGIVIIICSFYKYTLWYRFVCLIDKSSTPYSLSFLVCDVFFVCRLDSQIITLSIAKYRQFWLSTRRTKKKRCKRENSGCTNF
jgi:hypothetical protein